MNVRTDRDEQRGSGFQFSPPGPFLLRDYSNDDPDDLLVLRGLLEEILTQHKLLIPGSMNRLMIQWHADLHRATLPTPTTPKTVKTTGDPSGRR